MRAPADSYKITEFLIFTYSLMISNQTEDISEKWLVIVLKKKGNNKGHNISK